MNLQRFACLCLRSTETKDMRNHTRFLFFLFEVRLSILPWLALNLSLPLHLAECLGCQAEGLSWGQSLFNCLRMSGGEFGGGGLKTELRSR